MKRQSWLIAPATLVMLAALALPAPALDENPVAQDTAGDGEQGEASEEESLPEFGGEIEVRGQAERSQSVTVLAPEALESEHAANLNDHLFSGVPGVATSRRSNFGFSGPGAGFSIRGLSNPHVAVFVDGVPSQVNNHFHPRTDQYSPDMIHRLQVIRGPSAVEHGPSAVGGVIEIFTRRPKEGVSGFLQGLAGELDTQETMGDVGYGWGDGDLLVSFAERHTDAQTLGEAFDLRNVNLKLNQRVGSAWNLGVRLSNTLEDPADEFGSDPEEVFFRFEQDMTTYVLSLEREQAGARSLIAAYHNDLDTASFRETRAGGRFRPSSRTEQESGIFARHSWLRAGGRRLSVGLNAVRYSDTETGSGEEEESFASPFVHFLAPLGDRVTVDGGLRATVSEQFGTDLSPEIGAVWRPGEELALRARAGKAFRVPRVNEVHRAVINEDLDAEDFYHAEVGVNRRFGERAEIDVAAWWMEGDNLIQTVGSGAATQSLNTGEFSHQGVEAAYRVKVTLGLRLLVGAALLEVDQDTRFVPQQTVDLGVDFGRGPFHLNLAGRWAGDNSTEALDDYFVADARLSYDVLEWLRVMVDVLNLTDETYATITAGPNPVEQVPRTVLAGLRVVWGER